MLGTDGKLHIYDATFGKQKDAIDVVGPWQEPLDWQQPRPSIHVAGDTAYITEPATKALNLVDLKTGKGARSVTLPEIPNEITSIKG